MKVKNRCIYVFNPVGWDIFDPKTDLRPGELVRVIHPHGCPPPNTMGCAHVERLASGEFVGLVSTASLSPRST